MFLLVTPAGGKWWRLKYRFGGKEKLLSLGTYPGVSLKKAREARDEARLKLREGIDPSAERKASKAAQALPSENTFKAVAEEWLSRRVSGWAAGHAERTKRLLERDILPWVGARAIRDINPPELLEVLRRIENRGAVESAHRAMQACSQVFRYAVATGRAESDPARDLRGALMPYKSVNFAAVTDDMTRLAEILRAFDTYQGTLPVQCALRLMPLVFVRPGELRNAKWADIDLEGAEWRFQASKTDKPHVVPLACQAVEILRGLQPLTGRGEYVFPSARGAKRPMSDNAVLAAMRTMGIGKDEMSGHGFRAVARTLLNEKLGFAPEIIEHQLAHRVPDMHGTAYNRTKFIGERRAMMQRWADYLDTLKDGAEVVPINRKA